MEIYTTSQARENLYKLVDSVANSSEPLYIIGKRSKVVMIAAEDYKAIQETLYLLNIKGMKESIIEADNEPIEHCKKKLDW